MIIACKRKFEQNDDLKEMLLDTRETTIAEASPYDNFWVSPSNAIC